MLTTINLIHHTLILFNNIIPHKTNTHLHNLLTQYKTTITSTISTITTIYSTKTTITKLTLTK